MSNEENVLSLELLNAGFGDFVPHNKALGVSIIEASLNPAVLVGLLPWSEQIVGNPDTGVIHGGVVTTFLDAIGGAVLTVQLLNAVPVVTLDLRIDYLKPATTKRDIRARAECIKVTKHVGFVRAIAYHDDPSDPIALASATYMMTTKGQPVFQP